MDSLSKEKESLRGECERLRASLPPRKEYSDPATSPVRGAASRGGGALSAAGASSAPMDVEASVHSPLPGGWGEVRRKRQGGREGGGPC